MESKTAAQRIDESPLRPFQIGVFALCGLVVFTDGLDVQCIAYLAPFITADWGLERSALGLVFSAGLLGLTLGAVIIAPLGDRFGRRPLFLFSIAAFGVLTIASAWVRTPAELMAIRFATGLGLGCTVGNAIALTSEFSPARRRASVVMMMSVGASAGSAFGGWLVALLAPDLGWRTMFQLIGGLALLILPPVFFLLPESVRFMAQRPDTLKRAEKTLAKIHPDLAALPLQLESKAGVRGKSASVTDLLSGEFRIFTLLLWLGTFFTLITLYLVTTWLPTALTEKGLAPQHAAATATFYNAGAITGTIIMALLSDRLGTKPVMILGYCLAAAALIAFASSPLNAFGTAAILMCIGAGVTGGQIAITATGSMVYPTAIRSTGVGWGLGIGRIGSIIGPTLGAALFNLNRGVGVVFLVCAAPVICAALCVLLMNKDTRKANTQA